MYGGRGEPGSRDCYCLSHQTLLEYDDYSTVCTVLYSGYSDGRASPLRTVVVVGRGVKQMGAAWMGRDAGVPMGIYVSG